MFIINSLLMCNKGIVMPILDVIHDILSGKRGALENLLVLTREGQVTQLDIHQAHEEIDKILESDSASPKQQGQALTLRAILNTEAFVKEVNIRLVMSLLYQAIDLGSIDAMFYCANRHLYGIGKLTNYPEAIRLYEEAMSLGHIDAMYHRAYMHVHGLGGDINYPEALRLYHAHVNSMETIPEGFTEFIAPLKVKASLQSYQKKSIDLLVELSKTSDFLNQKSHKNAQYKPVATAVSDLHLQLLGEMGQFFTNPTALQFQQCHARCVDLIRIAAGECAQHRGWHRVSPILRGILGILAAIAVIPALIVHVKSQHGYVQTFFSTPSTVTSEKITAITKKYFEQKEEFEAQDNSLSAEIRSLKS